MNAYFWVAILFGLSISAFLFSYPNPEIDPNASGSFLSKYAAGQITPGYIFNQIIQGIFQWQNALSIAAIGAAVVLSGFNLIVLLPLGMIYILANMVILPPEFIAAAGLPSPVPEILSMFFGLVVVMVIIAFLRGQ